MKNNSIVSALKNAQDSKVIVSIHSNPANQSACSVGYVDQITKNKVRLYSVSPEGEHDGYEIRDINDVYRIDWGGKYEKKMELLKNNFGNIYFESKLSNAIEDDDLILTTLKEAKDKNLIVEVWTEDQDNSIIGYVESASTKEVRILSIDEYGQEDGFILITFASIADIDCDTRKCQQMKYLHAKLKSS